MIISTLRLTIGVIVISLCLTIVGCSIGEDRIEKELIKTNRKLKNLPIPIIDTLIPTQGYCSAFYKKKDVNTKLTITFPEPKPIDTVVLIPLVMLNSKNQYESVGFPLRFTIEAQTVDDETICIADCSKANFQTWGVSPVVLKSAYSMAVKSLSLELHLLDKSKILQADKYAFMLNELLVFSGEENIALNARVTYPEGAVHSPLREDLKFAPEYLVDGYSYFPAYQHAHNNPYRDFRSHTKEVRLIFDLGKIQKSNEVRFYPNDYLVELPHIHSAAIGFPMEIEVQLSLDSPFRMQSL